MIIHLSHNDLDGITSILLSRQFNIRHYFPCSYDKSTKTYFLNIMNYFISKYGSKITHIIITDINLSKEMLTYLDNSMNSINPSYKCLYIDHHSNTIKDLIETKTNYTCVINKDYSATKLYADMLSSINDERIFKYKDLINAVDGWDMWDFSRSPFSLDLQRAFYYHVFSRNTYEKFHERLYSFIKLLEKDPPTNDYKPNWYNKLLDLYNVAYQYTIDKAMEHVYNVDNIYCLEFFNEMKYIPAFEITLRLQQMNPNIKYFVYAFESNNDHIKISLRTNNSNNSTLNLSSIAEVYGGGGHEDAASFVILKSDFCLTLEKIIKELVSTNV